MEISLANKSPVNRRSNTEVPPPMVVVSPSVMSMEYKWAVGCHPKVTRLPYNGVAAAKRLWIEHLLGTLNLKLSVTVLEGIPSVYGCVWIEDVDRILRDIFQILNAETDEFCVEISYLGQILLFHRFKYIVRPAEASQGNCILLSSDPPPKMTLYESWLLKSDNIRTEDFRVSVSMRIENVD